MTKFTTLPCHSTYRLPKARNNSTLFSVCFPKAEEWPADTDDFLDSIFKLEDNQFNLIDNDLDAIPSSSSDSGLSSALSLSCEQQLSPLLPIEEDQVEISNSEVSSPQNIVDFESLGSPNQSMASVDSPVRSVVSSNIGSPATDIAEEMDVEHTFVAVVSPSNTLADSNATIIAEQPVVDLGKNSYFPGFFLAGTYYSLSNAWFWFSFTRECHD